MNYLIIFTISCYLLSASIGVFRLSTKLTTNKTIDIKNQSLIPAILAVILHGFLLYRWIDTSNGQNLSIGNMFSFLSWIIACITVAVSTKKPIENLITLVLPLAAISILFVLAYPEPESVSFRTDLILSSIFHILISIAALSILCLAVFQAVFIWLQNLFLKKNRFNLLIKILPPIETMEKLMFNAIWSGFILLTISFITAILFLEEFWLKMPISKLILSVFAWMLFSCLLIKRYRYGLTGSSAAVLTCCGVSLLIIAYFGSKIILR